MSVVETPVKERVPRNPQQQLAITSAIGAVVLSAALVFVFAGLPMLWSIFWYGVWVGSLGFEKNDFLSSALLILIELVVVGALATGAYGLLRKQMPPGSRSGIIVAAIFLVLALWIGFSIGEMMETQFDDNPAVGWIIVFVVMAAMLAGVGYLFLMVPAWAGLLEAIDNQGWFHLTSYKGNQGVRVRRGTIMGILAVGVCGIYTMVTHKFFGSDRAGIHEWSWVILSADTPVTVPFSNDWYWVIPFTNKLVCFPLMFKMHLIMPLVFGVLLFWFAWRVVNIPVFADFLIATEAEMNKVSWTSRKRLVQDTIVVLVTVVLFTGFLFVVDVLWIKILSAPGIQVLLYDPKQKEQEQRKSAEW